MSTQAAYTWDGILRLRPIQADGVWALCFGVWCVIVNPMLSFAVAKSEGISTNSQLVTFNDSNLGIHVDDTGTTTLRSNHCCWFLMDDWLSQFCYSCADCVQCRLLCLLQILHVTRNWSRSRLSRGHECSFMSIHVGDVVWRAILPSLCYVRSLAVFCNAERVLTIYQSALRWTNVLSLLRYSA